jgi:uncharacterized protein YraI
MARAIPLLICQLLLFCILSSTADASQIGHTTEDVNLRQGPSLSGSRIGRLKAGTEVEVINRDNPGWYFVLYKRQPGFIHERFVKVDERQQAAKQADSKPSKLVMLALIGVITLLVILMLARFKAWKISFACAGFLAVLNIGFKLDALYSLVVPWLAIVAIALWLSRERKRQTSSNKSSANTKKAA